LAKELFKFDIGDICGEYMERELDPYVEGFISEVFPQFSFDGTAKSLFDLWILLLNYADPYLRLEATYNDAVSIHNYGFDQKGRHLKTPGYGLFE
jgi:hypothetical protein